LLEERTNGRKPEEWLYPKPTSGKPFYRIKEELDEAIKQANLEEYAITAHYFRSWYATSFLADGGDPIVLMKSLGHSEFRTTLNHYEHYGIEHIVPHRNLVSVVADFGGVPV
jgi:integrase